jgi:hypothetical protein
MSGSAIGVQNTPIAEPEIPPTLAEQGIVYSGGYSSNPTTPGGVHRFADGSRIGRHGAWGQEIIPPG